MTVTFPREFPEASFRATDFKLVTQEATNRTGGGAGLSVELADCYWEGRFETGLLNARRRALWQAWADSLRSIRKFYGYDPDKAYPLNYGSAVLALTRFGGGAFDGTATLTGSTSSTLSINTLPPSYVVTVGDHVSIPMTGSQRSLHRAMESVTGNSSGAVTISVEPPVRAGAQTTAGGVQLVKPRCIMILKPGTFSAPAARALQSASFEGMQVLV